MCLPRIGTSWSKHEFIFSNSCQGTHKDEESLKNVKQLPGTSFVTGFNRLANNLDHSGEKSLEGFLEECQTGQITNRILRTSSALSSESMYWAMTPRDLFHKNLDWKMIEVESSYLTVVMRTSMLSGSTKSLAKSSKRPAMCDWKPSTMLSRTVNRIKDPTSRCATFAEVAVCCKKGRS